VELPRFGGGQVPFCLYKGRSGSYHGGLPLILSSAQGFFSAPPVALELPSLVFTEPYPPPAQTGPPEGAEDEFVSRPAETEC